MGGNQVTAVVVNYNSGDHLRACLGALLAETEILYQVIVVDNASADESWRIADDCAEIDPRVRLVRSDVNLGLAGGVNAVLEEITTPYAAILNPDVYPLTGWLRPMRDLLDEHSRAAVTCPVVLTAAEGLVNSAGQHVHVTGLGFNRHLGSHPDDVEDSPLDVDGLHGAAFLIRTEFLKEIGGWDATGFLYQEDVALSWDILLSGRRIVLVPDSRVVHDYHLTMYPEKLYLLERNRWALLLSHLRLRRLALLTIPLIISELLVWGLAIVRGPRFVLAKWRSYRWAFANRRSIRDWRFRVFSRANYDSANLGRNVHWGYPVGQLFGLGMERGDSARVPPGGLPV
jgi:GT2 family glycosyltransferase